MVERIAILGSTGSIGVQALEVAKDLGIDVVAMSGHSNIDLLEKQIIEHQPKLVSVKDEVLAKELKKRVSNNYKVEIFYGLDGLINVAQADDSQMLLTSVVGSVGLIPTICAIKKGKDIALANKETLVTAGKIVMEEARKNSVRILPVDSEHSAIFQCLEANDKEDLSKILLTASGGPFRGKKVFDLENVSLEDALKHPNWSMGAKITIDSATMMNKGLEVIEARWLFDVKPEEIEVVVHPQSIIHSMVEYVDGSVIAQLGTPDMKMPIQYALTYPRRAENSYSKLDIVKQGTLTFESPDLESFRCLKLSFDALKEGGTMPVVLNAANEVAVGKFLERKIRFLDIPRIIEESLHSHQNKKNPSVDDIIAVDRQIREGLL